jgi:hypothetical protein
MRIADPKPAYCSACGNSYPDGRYVDMEAAFDRGAVISNDQLSYVEGSDDLHLCEACVRAAAEVLAFKPDRAARQTLEIHRYQREARDWKAYAMALEQTVSERPERLPPRRGRPPKVPA